MSVIIVRAMITLDGHLRPPLPRKYGHNLFLDEEYFSGFVYTSEDEPQVAHGETREVDSWIIIGNHDPNRFSEGAPFEIRAVPYTMGHGRIEKVLESRD